ncbi:YtxH domain-containing protein [Bacillus sp. V5-8f]|uniref:YtxH domain-containing protein n=1 Tax=Bacillus sp. V5-8f TaxID=2053044 RepID=UPI0015E11203|nr:YtxH domain-containing protein [Bacillus sp. V5-8f]
METQTMADGQVMTDTYTMADTQSNSKLLKGIILGGIIGGAITLLDSSTRSKVKTKAVDLKDTSMDMLTQVKENPTEMKDQMVQRFKDASETLKEAINEAQKIYQTVNEDVFGKVNEVKQLSSDAINIAKDATGGIKEVGSKVAEAGTQLKNSTSSTTPTSQNTGTELSADVKSVSVNTSGNQNSTY